MSSYPDWLFQADPKSLAGSLIEYRRYHRQLLQAAAALQVDVTPDIQADRIFVMRHLLVEGRGAVAQTCTELAAWEADVASTLTGIVFQTQANTLGAAANNGVARDIDLEYVIRPKHHLTARVLFDAGVNANVLTVTASGWLLPRGNINL